MRKGIDDRRRIVREVSRQVRRCRNNCIGRVVGAADDRLLPSAEDEGGVLVNRAADGGAELIALERVLCIGEVIPRVEDPVADKFEGVAVPAVGAGFGHDVHHRAGVVAILCVETVGLHAELLQRVRKREGIIGVAHQVFVVRPVQVVADLVRPGAVDRNRFGARNLFRVSLLRARIAGRQIYSAGHQQRQVGGVSAVERNIHQARLLNHLAEHGADGVDLHGGCFDGDALGRCADLQLHVHVADLIGQQYDVLVVALESLRFHGDRIGRRRQRRDVELARAVGRVGSRHRGVELCDLDVRPGHDGTLRIRHRTGDRTVAGLSEGVPAERQQHH